MQLDNSDAAAAAVNTLEWLAKLAGSLVILWGFIARVLKPYSEWRRKHLAGVMREVLKDELAAMARITANEELCAQRLDAAVGKMEALYEEHDTHGEGMAMLTETVEEIYGLLDALGLHANDRRDGDERRVELGEMMANLADRRRQRRRRSD